MAEADCGVHLLRAAPNVGAEALAAAPAGAELYVLDEVGEFSLVRYGEQYGYVLTAYLRPAV
ncbi:MAG: SH3 domain-containing protein [Oscillospiraceae bacterium]